MNFSHGRQREEGLLPELTDEEKQKVQAKLKQMKDLLAVLLQKYRSQDYSDDALELTQKSAHLVPDFYTIWNYRRSILQSRFKDMDAGQKTEMIKQELKFLAYEVKENPKSYTLWFHRQWLLLQSLDIVPQDKYAFVRKDVDLCLKMLSLDERNFHCWNYRQWLLQLMDGPDPDSEIAFTLKMINKNFSNFSAWNFRAKSLAKKYATYSFEQKLSSIKSELELLRQAMFTKPNDQSVWAYHRWLIQQIRNMEVVNIEIDGQNKNKLLVYFSDPIEGLSTDNFKLAMGEATSEQLKYTCHPRESNSTYDSVWVIEGEDVDFNSIGLTIELINEGIHNQGGHKVLRAGTFKNTTGQWGSFEPTESQQHQEVKEVIKGEIDSLEELLEVEEDCRPAMIRQLELLIEGVGYRLNGIEEENLEMMDTTTSRLREWTEENPKKNVDFCQSLITEVLFIAITARILKGAEEPSKLTDAEKPSLETVRLQPVSAMIRSDWFKTQSQ